MTPCSLVDRNISKEQLAPIYEVEDSQLRTTVKNSSISDVSTTVVIRLVGTRFETRHVNDYNEKNVSRGFPQ
jgi:hypothetical protein